MVRAAGRGSSLGARAGDELREAVLKGCGLLETSPLLHGALLSVRGRRERNRAFSSPIVATIAR